MRVLFVSSIRVTVLSLKKKKGSQYFVIFVNDFQDTQIYLIKNGFKKSQLSIVTLPK